MKIETLNQLKNNHIVYFIYFLRKTKWRKLLSDLKYISQKNNQSQAGLFIDVIKSSFIYGTSFHEYFYYSFYEKSHLQRQTYVTTAWMYEFQLRMNPKNTRSLVEDKLLFLNNYSELIGRAWFDINKSTEDELESFLHGKTKVVLKNSKGQAGQNIKIINLEEYTPSALRSFASQNHFDLMEEYVYQHKSLMSLSPDSLNTLRIITQINNLDQVEIIGTILRLGIGQETDNLSTGGIACPIDPVNGIVSGPGISFDITKEDYYVHPINKKPLIGFKIPFWEESISLVKKAALMYPVNKSIGWDIAITDKGPILIEGNHNWGVRLWQLPVKKGLKQILSKYIND